MRRTLAYAVVVALSFSALAAVPAGAAAPCRDAKGHFIKCAPVKPMVPVKCKDAKGKFAKCATPGAKPV